MSNNLVGSKLVVGISVYYFTVLSAECRAQDVNEVYHACKFPYKVRGERDEVNFCTHSLTGVKSRIVCPIRLDEEGYSTDMWDDWGDCSSGTEYTRKSGIHKYEW